MFNTQASSRHAVREEIPKVQGLPYEQSTKVGRFAAWVVYFRDTFPDPYKQIKDSLGEKPYDDFERLTRNLHSALNKITGVRAPNRHDLNMFDIWAGALTAAVHTTSIVQSLPGVKRHFDLKDSTMEVSLKLLPVLNELVMEHQDRLGDIKIGLSKTTEDGYPALGSYELDPNLLEVLSNGYIRFKTNQLSQMPIDQFRSSSVVRQTDRPFVPNHGEVVVGDIVPRDQHIGCPLSFVGGFTESILRATTEVAMDSNLI